MSMDQVDTKRENGKVVFSLNSNTKKVVKTLTILYLVLFGFINLTLIIPSWVNERVELRDVLLANSIFIGISLFFIILMPLFKKFFNKSAHKTTDFIVLDKGNNTLYFKFEDISFDLKDIKEIKLHENKNLFGLTYFIVVVTDAVEKRIMPPLDYRTASQIKNTLDQELKN